MKWFVERASWTSLVVMLALSLLTLADAHDPGRDATDPMTPLFERQLEQMGAEFKLAPRATRHESPASENALAPAQQNAFILPSEAASTCAASGCFASLCGGSACFGSGCAGSACQGSGCVGSACENCNRPQAPGVLAMAGVLAYCPVDGGETIRAVRISGLEVRQVAGGTEIRFAASGAEVERYRAYRHARAGHDPVLVADGSISSDRVVLIVDPAAGKAADFDYTLEVIDRLGRATRTSIRDSIASKAFALGVGSNLGELSSLKPAQAVEGTRG